MRPIKERRLRPLEIAVAPTDSRDQLVDIESGRILTGEADRTIRERKIAGPSNEGFDVARRRSSCEKHQ
jgi:hypothetical protein